MIVPHADMLSNILIWYSRSYSRRITKGASEDVIACGIDAVSGRRNRWYTLAMENKTVLIVEDSVYLAESLVDMLEMHGYNTIHAKTGEQGIASALAHEPDLVLLDIRLPDISGYEVFRQIRETAWGSTARIMILTASESIENIAKNINLPLEDVMFKPEWSMQALITKIQQRLED